MPPGSRRKDNGKSEQHSQNQRGMKRQHQERDDLGFEEAEGSKRSVHFSQEKSDDRRHGGRTHSSNSSIEDGRSKANTSSRRDVKRSRHGDEGDDDEALVFGRVGSQSQEERKSKSQQKRSKTTSAGVRSAHSQGDTHANGLFDSPQDDGVAALFSASPPDAEYGKLGGGAGAFDIENSQPNSQPNSQARLFDDIDEGGQGKEREEDSNLFTPPEKPASQIRKEHIPRSQISTREGAVKPPQSCSQNSQKSKKTTRRVKRDEEEHGKIEAMGSSAGVRISGSQSMNMRAPDDAPSSQQRCKSQARVGTKREESTTTHSEREQDRPAAKRAKSQEQRVRRPAKLPLPKPPTYNIGDMPSLDASLEKLELGYIRSLVVENFKSYHGTHTFGPFYKYTAIIGQNGCGKSNVLDALSYVLGDSSKRLRGDKAIDFVYRLPDDFRFKREEDKPTRTSVTLDFCRGPNYVVDEKKAEENEYYYCQDLCFTRVTVPLDTPPITTDSAIQPPTQGTKPPHPSKLGATKTEYYLNGKRMLKEDYDRGLLSVGINPKVRNFLVFQGDVARKSSGGSKSGKDLLKFLEEACFSSMYREKCEKLTDKIELKREVMKSLTREERDLRTAAKKINFERDQKIKFDNLNQEVGNDKHMLYLFKLYVGFSEIRHRINQEQTEQKQIEELEAVAAKMAESVKKQRMVTAQIDVEVKKLEHRKRELDKKASLTDPGYIQANEEAKFFTNRKEKLKKNIAEATKQCAEAERQLEGIDHDEKRLKKKLEEKEKMINETLSVPKEKLEELARAKESVSSLETQLAISELGPEIVALTRDLKKATSALDDFTNIRTVITEKAEGMERELRSLREQLAKEKQGAAQHQARMEMIDKESEHLQGLKLEYEEKRRDLSWAEDTSVCKSRDFEWAEKQRIACARLRSEFSSTGGQGGVYGRLIDLCTFREKRDEVAINAIVGPMAHHVVVRNQAVAFDCIRFLVAHELTRMCFLPLEEMSEKENAHAPLVDKSWPCVANKAARGLLSALKFEAKYLPIMTSLFGSILLTDSLESATQIYERDIRTQKRGRAKIVTAKGEIVKPNGNFMINTSVSRDVSAWGVRDASKVRQKLTELEESLHRVHTELITLSEEKRTKERELRAYDVTRREVHEPRERLLVGHQAVGLAECERVEQELKLQEEKVRTMKREVAKREQEQQKREQELDEAMKAKFKDLKRPTITLGGLSGGGNGEKISILEADKRLRLQHQQGRKEKEQVEHELRCRAREREGLCREKKRLGIKEMKQELDEAEHKTQEAEKKMEHLNVSREGERKKLDACAEKLKLKEEEAEGQQKELEEAKKALKEKVEEKEKKSKELTFTVQQLEEQCNRTCTLILGSFEENMEPLTFLRGAREELEERFDALNGRELIRLEEGINGGGNGNKSSYLTLEIDTRRLPAEFKIAPVLEEFEEKKDEIQERICFNTEEMKKITVNPDAIGIGEKADQDLVHMLNRVQEEQTELKKYEAEFNEVNGLRTKKFEDCYHYMEQRMPEVYRKLMEGSFRPDENRLMLERDHPGDIFKGGLRFMARIPGKYLSEVRQLSGGEQSMAYLAMLFTIQMYTQPPFIILDEADAALDSVNTRLLVNYLNDADFQTVAISHKINLSRKADALIGVYKQPLIKPRGIVQVPEDKRLRCSVPKELKYFLRPKVSEIASVQLIDLKDNEKKKYEGLAKKEENALTSMDGRLDGSQNYRITPLTRENIFAVRSSVESSLSADDGTDARREDDDSMLKATKREQRKERGRGERLAQKSDPMVAGKAPVDGPSSNDDGAVLPPATATLSPEMYDADKKEGNTRDIEDRSRIDQAVDEGGAHMPPFKPNRKPFKGKRPVRPQEKEEENNGEEELGMSQNSQNSQNSANSGKEGGASRGTSREGKKLKRGLSREKMPPPTGAGSRSKSNRG